jgi:hypothetical protein
VYTLFLLLTQKQEAKRWEVLSLFDESFDDLCPRSHFIDAFRGL